MSHDYVRLNKLLAEQLGLSRREADAYILAGRVSVNGAVASLGMPVARKVDLVTVDDKPLATAPIEHRYLLLHKPAGYVCSRRQQGETPTIYQLLPLEFHSLKPVGRLDKDSSGLILLTNDGDFAHGMTHPSFKKRKVYYVTLDKSLTSSDKQQVSREGVSLSDGQSQLHISVLSGLSEQKKYSPHTYRIEMREGRNRQIRRTFAALGYRVVGLHRTQFGPFKLNGLRAGEWRSIKL